LELVALLSCPYEGEPQCLRNSSGCYERFVVLELGFKAQEAVEELQVRRGVGGKREGVRNDPPRLPE
jgi:hypothetical protein